MLEAYVLFSVTIGSEQEALKDIKKIEGVQEVNVTFGVHDLIAKIEVDSLNHLKELVSQRLRKVNNVRSTLTLILTKE